MSAYALLLTTASPPLILPPEVVIKFQKEDEWMIDPVIIADTYGPEGLDFVVDGGVRVADPSTVVDMTKMPPKVLRQGKVGPILHWMEFEDDQKTEIDKDLIPAGI
ncbi:hypothetical protein V8G54_018052 [Vigna mungo]|uniref:Uncharacterized protein n=1 Tax=Vigna mungo TaxID=3915 RepID=A0AAQ3N8N1_VIGMU